MSHLSKTIGDGIQPTEQWREDARLGDYQPPRTVNNPKCGEDLVYPKRIVQGTLGHMIEVTTNHHAIRFAPNTAIWRYEMRITIPEDSYPIGANNETMQRTARAFVMRNVTSLFNQTCVFDGVSNLWSPQIIVPEGESRTTTVAMEARRDKKPNSIQITLTNKGRLDVALLARYLRKGEIDLDPAGNSHIENQLKWLQATFRQDPASRLVTRPNSNAYFDLNPSTTIGLKSTGRMLEALRGIFQTVQIRFGRLTMNIDAVIAPFWVSNRCLTAIAASLMHRSVGEMEELYNSDPVRFRTMCSKLYGIYFHVKHLGDRANSMKLKLRSFSHLNAKDTVFDERMADGSTARTSVADYFRRKYKIKLRYPQLPLVSTSRGDFPLEVCYSADTEPYRQPLKGDHLRDLIKIGRCVPEIRQNNIDHGLSVLRHGQNKTLSAHGISLEPVRMKLVARNLPPPTLRYYESEKKHPIPQQGEYRFSRASTIRSWGMVYLYTDTKPGQTEQVRLNQFRSDLINTFKARGMTVPIMGPSLVIEHSLINMELIVDTARQKAKTEFGHDPDILFFIIRSHSVHTYNSIKMELDVKVGIASQVLVLQDRLQTGYVDAAYIRNIALKVNVKLGGTNWHVGEPVFGKYNCSSCMLVGGDISHPSGENLMSVNPQPSCAALVGTWDRECTAYTAILRAQEPTLATIAGIGSMFMELLHRYKQKQGMWPLKIIYYRDGVSESEFDGIKNKEWRPMKHICKQIGKPIKITVVVGIKRHHTRFFGRRRPSLGARSGALDRGTVVENSSTTNDAYIIAHTYSQGTQTPTRYVTIVDENSLSADDFQRLTLNICFSYARCTSSVGLCPPIYYAHQACGRGRYYCKEEKQGTEKVVVKNVHRKLDWNMWWQ